MKKNRGGLSVEVLAFVTAAAAVLFLAGCFGIGWVFGLGMERDQKNDG